MPLRVLARRPGVLLGGQLQHALAGAAGLVGARAVGDQGPVGVKQPIGRPAHAAGGKAEIQHVAGGVGAGQRQPVHRHAGKHAVRHRALVHTPAVRHKQLSGCLHHQRRALRAVERVDQLGQELRGILVAVGRYVPGVPLRAAHGRPARIVWNSHLLTNRAMLSTQER